MSFTLHDLGTEGFQFSSNVWNWKAALQIIKSLDIVSEGTVRQMAYNATGVKIQMEDAHALGKALKEKILPRLEPNKRIYGDLHITDSPDDMTLYRSDDERQKNYSVNRDWIAEFADFCLQSKGFQVF